MKKYFVLFVATIITSACGKVEKLPYETTLHSNEATCLDTTNNSADCKGD